MTTITSFGRLIITYLALTALILDPRNPRRHSPRQIRQIAWSIKAFGFPLHLYPLVKPSGKTPKKPS